MKLFVTFLIAFCLASIQLHAQVQFEIAVGANEMGRKDELQVEYVISGADKITNFRPPYFNKWKVVSGPAINSQSYNMNGISSSTYKYIYVLSPAAAGKLRIPGTTVTLNGKQVSCKAVTIQVKDQDHVDGVAPGYTAPQADLMLEGSDDFKEYDLKPGEDPVKKMRNNLFVKAIPSKKKCFVGEPVMVTYKLYTALKSNSRVVKQPSFSGCSVSEMTTSNISPVVETVNGKKYATYVFRKVQLFPLQAGRITAGIASVDNSVKFITGRNDFRRSYYEPDPVQEYNLILSTEPFTIEVLPLPGNKTAVGNFEIVTQLKKDTITANETNALIVSIVGEGNFKSVTEPQINWPGGLYHFDATETDELDKLSFPLAGKKIYEIPFEVNAAGKIDIPPVSFSYFDPARNAYKTVQSKAVQLTVLPAVTANIQQSVMSGSGNGMNIRYLLYLLPVIFLVGGIIIWRASRKRLQPSTEVDTPQEEIIPVKLSYDARSKIDALVLLQDDTRFYNGARDLAKDLIALNRGDHDLLLQVLQDCNTQLYTPIPSTSRKEVLDKLSRAIA